MPESPTPEIVAVNPSWRESSYRHGDSGENRDAMKDYHAGHWPIRLIDTAGLRLSDDLVERLGIEMSERYVVRAHLLIACGETRSAMERTSSVLSRLSSAPVVSVLTKSDLVVNRTPEADAMEPSSYVSVSVVTGDGLKRLQEEIDVTLTETYGELNPELPVLVRARPFRG